MTASALVHHQAICTGHHLAGIRLASDSWNVSSAGPQDWPYCGDQCNPSGPDIFTGAFTSCHARLAPWSCERINAYGGIVLTVLAHEPQTWPSQPLEHSRGRSAATHTISLGSDRVVGHARRSCSTTHIRQLKIPGPCLWAQCPMRVIIPQCLTQAAKMLGAT
jgi:hypothetical protein